jgi:hypothetical protein
MTTDLVSLERELERLAHDFAIKLIWAALRARVEELDVLVESTTFEPEAFPVDLVPPRRRGPRVLPPTPAAPAQRSRRTVAPRPAPVLRRAPARRDEPEDDDTMANMITDPGLLLDVIEAGNVPSRRSERPEAGVPQAGRVSKLLRDPVARASEPEQGPALRPGERLQRTAGGNVVLRRGRT